MGLCAVYAYAVCVYAERVCSSAYNGTSDSAVFTLSYNSR